MNIVNSMHKIWILCEESMEDINWYKYKKKYRPVIVEISKDGRLGEEFELELETKREVYFNNADGRYSYYNKSEEDKFFKWIKRGDI